MKMNRKIFFTGGKGFIGREIIPLFRKDGYDVVDPSSKELDLLDSVVKCNIKSWEENGKMFVKYIHDFEMNNVDLVFLDGPGHFNHEFDAGKCNIITHRWNKKCEESKKHIHEVKTSINYNYYDILVEQNKPVYCIIDGRSNTRSFYQDFLKEKKWDKMPMGKWEGVDTLQ